MSKGWSFILHHTADCYQYHLNQFVHTFQVMFSHEDNIHTKLVFFQLQFAASQCMPHRGFLLLLHYSVCQNFGTSNNFHSVDKTISGYYRCVTEQCMCGIETLGSLVEGRLSTFPSWWIQNYHICSNAMRGFP